VQYERKGSPLSYKLEGGGFETLSRMFHRSSPDGLHALTHRK
jgi:hypothetical protein